MGLERVAGDYKGYRKLQEVTVGNKGLKWVTGD